MPDPDGNRDASDGKSSISRRGWILLLVTTGGIGYFGSSRSEWTDSVIQDNSGVGRFGYGGQVTNTPNSSDVPTREFVLADVVAGTSSINTDDTTSTENSLSSTTRTITSEPTSTPTPTSVPTSESSHLEDGSSGGGGGGSGTNGDSGSPTTSDSSKTSSDDNDDYGEFGYREGGYGGYF